MASNFAALNATVTPWDIPVTIQNRRFQIFNVPGDGDCFFHCLSFLLHGDLLNTQMFRNLICGHILHNWETYVRQVEIVHGPSFSSSVYEDCMINAKWWAGSCEIQVASVILNRKINVWLVGKNKDDQTIYTLTTYTPAAPAGSLDLLLSRHHFLALKCLDSVNSNSNVHMIDNGESYKHQTFSQQTTENQIFKDIQADTGVSQEFYAVPIRDDAENTVNSQIPVTEKRKVDTENGQQFNKKHCVVGLLKEATLLDTCRKLGIWFEESKDMESDKETSLRRKRIKRRVKCEENKLGLKHEDLPEPPPLTDDLNYNKAMDAIRSFELEQMSYSMNKCSVCLESKVELKLNKSGVCKRCSSDKEDIKMFSSENMMNPGILPVELTGLSIVEQQLICRISPCMNVHMLKHGGIASSGHCVTFPQEINEPAQIFPRLPQEIDIIKVRKQGLNGTSKDFRVRRFVIETALHWLKENNPAYEDITICKDRLNMLPVDDELDAIPTTECGNCDSEINDKGPAPDQIELSDIEDCNTSSAVLLPDQPVDIEKRVKKVVQDIVGDNHGPITTNARGTITIPWPTRGNEPLSEFTTQYFFTLAFPCLFPYGTGDYHINRPRTCFSISDWAEHLIWFEDGRFARHKYFKFVVHNIIIRKQAIEKGSFIVKQKLGDPHMTVQDLQQKLEEGDTSIARNVMYFSDTLRGTSQYWTRRNKELRSLVHYKINNGDGLPSIFTTGSCAEYHFKPLRRLLSIYINNSRGQDVNFDNHSELFEALQENTHIVAQYFDLRTQSYFDKIMGPLFGVNTYWYRQEFAKSRGMVHWHGLCWRHDREPHNMLYKLVQDGLSDSECAEKLSQWAQSEFGMSAKHPAGSDLEGNPRKDLWPPPEGTAPKPPEDKNPLVKLLMDVSTSQESILEDFLLLCNRFNLHRCSDYCLRANRHKSSLKECRMEFGTEDKPGKPIRSTPALVKDRNRSLRLEMERDHPVLVQNSRYHTQGWRANGDISLIISKSDPENPSVDEIMATEKYITGYACKGNQSSDSLINLFQDMANTTNEASNVTSRNLCQKFLMKTVKRDVSAIEASYELSRLPLYRSSHTFTSISLSGFRVLENDGKVVTKSTMLDKYLSRNQQDKCSFYSFVCRNGKVPVFSCSIQATWPLQEEYSKIQLLLHWPSWIAFSDIKDTNSSWTETLEHFLCTDKCPNFVKADVERAKQKANDTNCEDEENDVNDDNHASQQPDWMDTLRPNIDYEIELDNFVYDDGGEFHDWTRQSTNYPENLGVNFINDLHENVVDNNRLNIPNIDLLSLNEDQLFAFNIAMTTIELFKSGDQTYHPLRMIVTGTAGSGKSHLIKCIVKATRLLFESNKSVQIVCPTGNSANIIDGVTLHSFLKVPTSQKGKEMCAPDGSLAEALQSNLEGLKVLLVDERSLIGTNTLGWMEFMCRNGACKGQNSNESWGGLPVVIFFGDDVQLPPVLDSPVYLNQSTSPASLHGALVWKEFNRSVQLCTIVRQNNNEKQLKDVLLSLREYKSTPEHCTWLQQFQWNNLKSTYGEEVMNDMHDRGLFVFPTHKEVWEHNKCKLLQLNQSFPIAQVKSENRGVHSKTPDSEGGGGLCRTLYICKNAKVMLSVNLSVEHGLFNGAIGTIIDILYTNGRRPPIHFPDVVMVDFPVYSGPSFVENYPTIVPIVPVERKIDCRCRACYRKQMPLRLGWGTTIHKCQGMTIGEGELNRYIVINPGTRKFESQNPGALFVAMSRAKSTGNVNQAPDFAWNPFTLINQDRICHVVKTKTTNAREKEIKRIRQLSKRTIEMFSHLKTDTSLCAHYNELFYAEE